jgi:hypothetical protein
VFTRPQGQFTIAPTFLFGSGYAGVGKDFTKWALPFLPVGKPELQISDFSTS